LDAQTKISLGELVRLCAVDSDLYARYFFPKAARQISPPFLKEVWYDLENPASRFVNLRVFRGGSKTTTLRLFTSKRIAYGISRTILYIGASEAHATRSVRWLQRAIARRDLTGANTQTPFAQTFDLRPGVKWSETELEVYHGIEETPIWVLGVGITGNIRGINFDDYRPDLIVCDDVVTDENAATTEQREKIIDLVLGAVMNSLAPSADAPNAKMAILQTPINSEDISALASKSPSWKTSTFGCWTEQSKDFPLEFQKSVWEERYPTEELQKQKQAAIALNKLSTFLREMECKITAPELCPLKADWLQYYDELPRGGMTVLAIDPVPPPSDVALAKGLSGRDWEAQTVWRRVKGEYYLVDLAVNRGHEPNWSVTTAMELALRHGCARIVVESIAYQRTLEWLLKKEMQRRGIYFVITDTSEISKRTSRSKHTRIVNVLSGPASQRHIHVRKSHTAFITQWTEYRPGIGHDDILDSSSLAIGSIVNPFLELAVDEYGDDTGVEKVKFNRGCP